MNFSDLNNQLTYVAPSLLAADFVQLNNELKDLANIGVKVLHLDVMDGHFVPNISFGAGVIQSLKSFNDKLIFDAHLMVTNPVDYIESFKHAGCDHITFHFEAVENEVKKVIEAIRQSNLSVGISIKPQTPIVSIIPYLELVDLALIMTVEPGFGGQRFIDFSDKIATLHQIIINKSLSVHIQVDGGINAQTSQIVRQAGANVLVAGTSFFRHPQGQKIALEELINNG